MNKKEVKDNSLHLEHCFTGSLTLNNIYFCADKGRLRWWVAGLNVYTGVPLTQNERSIPGFASDEYFARVHDPTGETSRVDGPQGRAELDNVGPDQRLRQEPGVLPRRRRFVLPCVWRKKSFITQKQVCGVDVSSKLNLKLSASSIPFNRTVWKIQYKWCKYKL